MITGYQGQCNGCTEERIRLIAENRDAIISTIDYRGVQYIKQINPALVVLFYFNVKGVHESSPLWQQVEDSDLFWRDEKGELVQSNRWRWTLVDPRSGDWSNLVIDHLADKFQYDDGYDGVFLDEFSVFHENDVSSVPFGYDRSEYYDALYLMMGEIRAAYPDKVILFNGYNRWIDRELSGMTILNEGPDGMMFEGVCYKLDTGAYVGEATLLRELKDFYAVSNEYGKIGSYHDYGPSTDYQRRMFSLASFLMVAGQYSFYSYGCTDISPEDQNLPEYDLDLGDPLGEPYEYGQGVWIRDYQYGTVITNPTNESVDVWLGWGKKKLTLEGGVTWDNPGRLVWERTWWRVRMSPATGLIIR